MGFGKIFGKIKTISLAAVGTACVVHAVSQHVALLAICEGDSMFPTLSNGDVLLINRFTYRWLRRPTCGDVVILRKPNNPLQAVVKRITGCTADMDCLESGIKSKNLVKKSHVWVSGDNRSTAIDSRHYGAVPERLIIGLAVLRLWPKFGRIPELRRAEA